MRHGYKNGVAPVERGDSQTHAVADYTPDEVEFMKAIALYQKTTGRKFLTHVEVLRIAEGLGYRRDKPTEGT